MTKEEAKNILYEWLEPKDNKTVSSDDFSEAIETLLEEINFVDNLVKLREQERKVKLPELIDLWWMQEDRDGNRLVETKEHFASAMKKAYSIGLSHEQTSIPEPASDDLEKEIGKYTTNHLLKKRNYSTGVYHLTQKDCDDIARHFAEWQKQKSTQDFLEKAERYLKHTLYDRVEIEVFGTLIPSIVNKKAFIENFKNHMQNESEN